LLPPYVISAIVYGSLFGLMAIGLTWTYMTTKVPNFAFGDFVTIGLYVVYTLSKVDHINPYYGSALAFAVAGLGSVLMYIGVLRPLARRGSSLVSLMIATFGVDIVLTGVFGIYTDYLTNKYRLSDAKQFFPLQGDFVLGGQQGIVYVAPLVLAVVTVGIYLLFTKTKFGVAMRASVENSSLARVLGINVERVNIASWLLAGGFAGLAGALYALWLPGGTSTGSDLIVEVFAASILGGLSSIFGAILGGLLIGGGEILGTTYLELGMGYIGAALIVLILVAGGALLLRRKRRNQKISGVVLFIFAAYVLIGFVGQSGWFITSGIVSGFGANALEYQKGIPLLIMVFALLIIPKGVVSLDFGRLLRLGRKK
jgi:branched-chain amino acid transport system permease protein